MLILPNRFIWKNYLPSSANGCNANNYHKKGLPQLKTAAAFRILFTSLLLFFSFKTSATKPDPQCRNRHYLLPVQHVPVKHCQAAYLHCT